jgi:hypothetical protein
MASDLFKIGRLITNGKFITIVEAAILKHAQTIPLGGTLTAEKNFAIWALKYPMQPEVSMIALVASDPTVLAATTIEDDLINADAITDESVMAVVSAKWSLVASKYPISSPY